MVNIHAPSRAGAGKADVAGLGHLRQRLLRRARGIGCRTVVPQITAFVRSFRDTRLRRTGAADRTMLFREMIEADESRIEDAMAIG